ncbi:hypothetical protein CDEST_11292 [Colletotrichum destructivum]|uniref:Uncharacterized protein n=1 Tax=Colletotrichum destructivum TaxID=34406 RepID=A0AAX4IST6_9PEZI|nr:hypothetical protein CDEST_11292 [Colletotrichum destructivum]
MEGVGSMDIACTVEECIVKWLLGKQTDECRRRHICAVGEGNSNHSPVLGTKTWMTAQDDNETGVDH